MTHAIKLSFARCTILLLILILPFASLSSPKGETDNTIFTDDFEGTSLDPQKWIFTENTNMSGYPANGGSISVADGFLELSSSGSSFPFIYSAENPFPSSGDFEIEFAIKYTCIADLGCGVMISNGVPALDINWHNYKVITLWAHDQGPSNTVIYMEFYNSGIYSSYVHGFKPSSAQHIYKVSYSDGVYSIYVDGEFAGRGESEQRPNMIIFGNPPNPEVPRSPQELAIWGYWGWSSFKIDYVIVTSGTNSVPQSNEPTTPTPNEPTTPTPNEQTTLTLAKPTLEVSGKSSPSYFGFNVQIKGSLIINETAIPESPILLSYSVDGGKSWEKLTLVYTSSDGGFSASWLPSVTGNYLIQAEYEGNGTYLETEATASFAVISFTDKDVFWVTSNSTVSSLVFDSENQELSFAVAGPSGTIGYVDAWVAKNIIEDVDDVKAYIDGSEVEYTTSSVQGSWLIHLTYQHSSHEVLFSLGSKTSKDLVIAPESALTTALVFTGIVAATTLLSLRKKGKA